ncbi:Methyltransferase domain-containing protein [Flavobacterium gillisiae]|uniref:Methyltransferase domain-containing protein n=1 Tax=Flavobacterium gillisiae TaxID=150146 RepID=A0A1H4EWP8_9FLAO|nr:methyltransferase domain-containing protein [Flavobacterium gillisiae]SEA89379.1 Methyltransferase domain-containing protein [Flavobacterium gillisiae]
MHKYIIHPDTHSKLASQTEDCFLFEDKSKLRIHNGTPILFSIDSIFNEEDVIIARKTTQDSAHLDTSNIKNFIRRKLLPSLCNDFNIDKRYDELSTLLSERSIVLIIGVGEKAAYYKNKFSHCVVITSDVHNEFKPDYIFDGHYIPFSDNCFDMVLAAQVIEHTINPWKFCQELQRVTKIGGLLQIEAPQTFPYHAEPYDFFRFTYTGMRSLFPQCAVIHTEITEGNASMVAVTISNYLINTSSKRLIRSSWLFITRILLGWLKYLDKLQALPNRRTVSMPKGYAFTFKKDTVQRKPIELLNEFYELKR